MKNKTIIIAICLILLVLIIVAFILTKDDNKKFYLEDKYYNEKGLIELSNKQVNKLINDKKSFILFSYNNYCSYSKPCDDVFEQVAKKNKVEILQIPFTEFKKTKVYKEVKYAPSIILINDGKIIDYLDTESDEDKDLYQDEEKFYKWLDSYIYFKK